MERCLGKGKNITSGIALTIQVPYFVCLSCNQHVTYQCYCAALVCCRLRGLR